MACESAQEGKNDIYGITRSLKDAALRGDGPSGKRFLRKAEFPAGRIFALKRNACGGKRSRWKLHGKQRAPFITYRMERSGTKLTCGREAAQLTAGEFNRMVSMVAYKAEAEGGEKAPYS